MFSYPRALAGFALIVGFASVLASHSASATGLDFLNHMNPEYTKCISNVRASMHYRDRNDGKLQNAVVNACNRAHPAFGKG
ncbi:hypothetical protein IVA88_29745 [Bradyrhizobium sp. 149]|uniref:hypothetical protein n=1 Tax=Bradyrhizobium sp. 149 TaxID=2782624 RepID=UPI001FFB59D6|nr:hypothetical protein [Bradyrhizobium sp. 149]MCK1655581.1 hypothetical protein [Bradyrhizobium sp. 149]